MVFTVTTPFYYIITWCNNIRTKIVRGHVQKTTFYTFYSFGIDIELKHISKNFLQQEMVTTNSPRNRCTCTHISCIWQSNGREILACAREPPYSLNFFGRLILVHAWFMSEGVKCYSHELTQKCRFLTQKCQCVNMQKNEQVSQKCCVCNHTNAIFFYQCTHNILSAEVLITLQKRCYAGTRNNTWDFFFAKALVQKHCTYNCCKNRVAIYWKASQVSKTCGVSKHCLGTESPGKNIVTKLENIKRNDMNHEVP